MAKSRIITAPKVKLLVNGKTYGRVTSFNWSSESPRSEKYGLDSMQAFELASTITRGSGNMTVLRLSADGGAEGAGITATYPDLSREKYFSVTMIEIGSEITIFQARRCALTSQSWNIQARGVMAGSLSFDFIDFSNETARFAQS